MGVDVEELPAGSHAAAHFKLVPGEGKQHHIVIRTAQFFHRGVRVFPLGAARRQMARFLRDRYIFHPDYQLAALFLQTLDKLTGHYLAHVFLSDGNGSAEDYPHFSEGEHAVLHPPVYARAAPCVRLILPALNAQHGDEVAAFVKQVIIPLIDICAVGEYRENHIAHPPRRLYNIAAYHRLAARKHYKAYAQLLCLGKYTQPFLIRQLIDGGGIHRGVAAS